MVVFSPPFFSGGLEEGSVSERCSGNVSALACVDGALNWTGVLGVEVGARTLLEGASASRDDGRRPMASTGSGAVHLYGPLPGCVCLSVVDPAEASTTLRLNEARWVGSLRQTKSPRRV
jgi:hypothetical protein